MLYIAAFPLQTDLLRKKQIVNSCISDREDDESHYFPTVFRLCLVEVTHITIAVTTEFIYHCSRCSSYAIKCHIVFLFLFSNSGGSSGHKNKILEKARKSLVIPIVVPVSYVIVSNVDVAVMFPGARG